MAESYCQIEVDEDQDATSDYPESALSSATQSVTSSVRSYVYENGTAES